MNTQTTEQAESKKIPWIIPAGFFTLIGLIVLTTLLGALNFYTAKRHGETIIRIAPIAELGSTKFSIVTATASGVISGAKGANLRVGDTVCVGVGFLGSRFLLEGDRCK